MEIRLCHILLIIFQDDITIREKENLPSVETYFHRSMILLFYVFLLFLSFENMYNRNATFRVYYSQTWLLSTYDKVVGLMSILMSNAWITNMDVKSHNIDKLKKHKLWWNINIICASRIWNTHITSSKFDTILISVITSFVCITTFIFSIPKFDLIIVIIYWNT